MSPLRYFQKQASKKLKSMKNSSRSGSLMLTLEPRFLYDAAGLVTGLDILSENPQIPDHDALPAGLPDSGFKNFDLSMPSDFNSPAPLSPEEIIFVDPSVDDYQQLTSSISSSAQIVILDSEKDGILQISQTLSGLSNIKAVHVISHGTEASLSIGGSTLSAANLQQYGSQFEKWQSSLTKDADIMLYGCNIAAGDSGFDFISSLAELTLADVAASDDLTGSAEKGGDWELEQHSGDIEAEIPFSKAITESYSEILAAPVIVDGGATNLNYTEGQGARVIDSGGNLSVTDTDGTISSAKIKITNHVLGEDRLGFIYDSGGDVTGSWDGSTGELSLTTAAPISVSEFSAVLNNITYENLNENPNTTSRFVRYTVNDGTTDSNIVFIQVNINAVDTAPTVTAGASINFAEGDSATIIDNTITITDPDSQGAADITGATITINNAKTGDRLALHPDYAGLINESFSGNVLTLSGNSNIADYQSALRYVTFSSTAGDAIFSGTRTIDFTVTDSSATPKTSAAATCTVIVTSDKDDPTLAAGDFTTTQNYDENTVNTTPQILDASVTFNDPDQTDLDGGKITITGLDSADIISVKDTTNITLNGNDVEWGGTIFGTVSGGRNGTDFVVTFNAQSDSAKVDELLENITYQNSSHIPTLQHTITLSVTDGDGGSTGTRDMIINIAREDDAPVVTASGGSPTFTEDSAHITIDSNIIVEELDGDTLTGATITILAAEADDLLSFTNIGAITNNGYAGGVLTLTGNGTAQEYQDALRTVTYGNDSDLINPTKSIEFKVSDAKGPSSSTTKTINVAATNDSPTLTQLSTARTFNENDVNAGGQLLDLDAIVNFSDKDSGDLNGGLLRVLGLIASDTVSVKNMGTGSGNVRINPLDTTQVQYDTNGSGNWVHFGTIHSVNNGVGTDLTITFNAASTNALVGTLIANLTYANSLNTAPADHTLTLSVTDGDGGSTGAKTIDITINSQDDSPVLTPSGVPSQTFTEDGTPLIIDSGLTVAELDGDNIISATVEIPLAEYESGDTLNFTNTGTITGSWDSNTRILTLTPVGTATADDFQNAFRTITFENDTDPTNSSIRNIEFTVNDATGPSNTAVVIVNVSNANDAPILGNTPNTVDFNEGSVTGVVINPQVTISDSDDSNIDYATISIVNYEAGQDVLQFTAHANITAEAFDIPSGSLTLNANTLNTVSKATFLAALNSNVLYFNSNADNPFAGTRTIRFTINDGDADSSPVDSSVNVIASNDIPTISTGATLNYTEADPASVLDNTVTINDLDSYYLRAATITISTNWENGDILELPTTANISSAWDGAGKLTLTSLAGKASVTDYQAALRSVTYRNTTDNPTSGSRQVSWAVSDDGINFSAVDTSSINVTSINNPPDSGGNVTVTDTSDNTLSIAEDTAGATNIRLAPTTISDPDSGQTPDSLRILSVTGGVLKKSNGDDLILGASSSDILPLTAGKLDLQFTPSADRDTNATFTYAMVDSSDNTLNSSPSTATITIDPLNDAPSAGGDVTVKDTSDNNVSILEDSPAPTAANIRLRPTTLSDPDTNQTPASVRIISVTGGSIANSDGSAITLGTAGTILNLSGGNLDLRFTPTADRDTDATFTYVMVDSGNNAVNSASSTATITITAINDKPEILNIGGDSASFTEAASPVKLDSGNDADITDVDDAEYSGGYLNISMSANKESGDQLTIENNDDGDADSTTKIFNSGGSIKYDNVVIGSVDSTHNGINGNDLRINFSSAAATDAAVAALMKAVRFENSSSLNSQYANDRTISFTAHDGSAVSDAENVTVSMTSDNVAPVLDNSQSPVLTGILEDPLENSGTNDGNSISEIIINGSITDADGTAIEAMAVTNVDNTNGFWQYSLDNGTTWTNFSNTPNVPVDISANARLLDGTLTGGSTHKIRFSPAANWGGGSPTFTFRAWDKNTGTAGQTANASSGGGITAFSSNTDTAQIIVTSRNDAPSISGLNGDTQTYSELTGNPVLLGAATGIVDVDSTDFDTGSLTVTINGGFSGDQLSIITGGNISSIAAGNITHTDAGGTVIGTFNSDASDTVPLTISLNGNATPDRVVDLIARIAYDSTSSNPDNYGNNTSRSISFVLKDGDGIANSGSDTSSASSTTLYITPSNEAPSISNIDGDTVSFKEGDIPVQLDLNGNALINDVDNPDYSNGYLLVSITANKASGDQLTIADDSGGNPASGIFVSGSDVKYDNTIIGTIANSPEDGADSNDLKITFNSTAADNTSVSALIKAIRFQNTSEDDVQFSADRTITFKPFDGETLGSSHNVTVLMTEENDAPVLNNTGDMSFPTSINANDADTAGDLISAIIATSAANGGNAITDVDTADIEGIAVIAVDDSNGTWYYDKLSNNNWTAFTGNESDSSATLLLATAKIKFIPAPGYNNAPNPTITFRAWDAASGSNGDTLVDTSGANHGGKTAFSSDTETARLTVIDINDAPLLDDSGSPALTSITEDAADPAGDLISTAFGSILSDPDNNPSKGIAVNGLTGTGTWQFKTSAGSWTDMGAVSSSSALLLKDTASIRFIPTPGFNNSQTSTISFRAWDQTVPNPASETSKVDPGIGGGTTGFSTNSETANLEVTAVNDAPVLDNTGTMILTPITEDATAPAGDTISAIIATGGADMITDADNAAVEGIAVTAVDSTNGTWYYDKLADGNWTAFTGNESESSATLLLASAKIKFIPTAGYNNAQTPAITFRAWDTSAGNNGDTGVDTSGSNNGGATAFSSATETASIAVTDVNDAPLLNDTNVPSLTSVTEDATDPAGDLISTALGSILSDPDSNNHLEGIAITGVNGDGTWQYKTSSGAWTDIGTVTDTSALLLKDTARLRFIPTLTNNNAQTADITFRAWDQTNPTSASEASKVDPGAGGGTTGFSANSETAILEVTSVNDAPTLTGLNNPAAYLENSINSAAEIIDTAVSFADVDLGDFDGGTLTVSGLNSSDIVSINSMAEGLNNIRRNGTTVEYDANGSGSWTLFGTLTGGNGTDLVVNFNSSANASLIDTLIENINYKNTSDAQNIPLDTHTLDITVTDGDGGSTGPQSLTISITAENDAPAITLPDGNVTFVEDGSPVFLDPAAIISDAEMDALNNGDGNYNGATLTIVRNGGASTDDIFNISTGGNIIASSPNIISSSKIIATYSTSGNQIQISFTDANGVTPTTALVKEVLRAIKYSNSNNNPPASITLDCTINDGNSASAQGLGSAMSDTANLIVNITPTNDPPTATPTVFTITYDEDPGANVPITDIVVSDPDAGDQITATLTLSNSSAGDLTANDGALYNAGVWSITGSVSVVNAALAGVEFIPAENNDIDVTIDIDLKDLALDQQTGTITLDVTPVNDAPVIIGNSNLYDVTQNAVNPTPKTVTNLIASNFTDVDNGASLAGIAIEDNAAVSSTEGTWQYSSNSGTDWFNIGTPTAASALVISSSALIRFIPATDYLGIPGNITIRGLDNSYSGAFSTTAGSESRQYIDTANNGGTTPIAAASTTASVEVISSQAPSVGVTGSSSFTFREGDPALNIGLFQINDVDNRDEITEATISITGINFEPGYEKLTFTAASNISGSYNDTTGILTLSGTASKSQYATVLNSIKYEHTSENPGSGDRIIKVRVQDNDPDGPYWSTAENLTVTVNAINDAPVFTDMNSSLSITEGDAAISIFGNNAGLSDPELDIVGNSYTGAVLTLVRQGGADSNDVFGSSGTLAALTPGVNTLSLQGVGILGDVTTNSNGTLVLSFNSNLATKLRVDEVLKSITYQNTDDAPESSVTIDYVLSDGNLGAQGLGGTLTGSGEVDISITPVNDPPDLDLNAGAAGNDFAATYFEGSPEPIVDSAASIIDPDDANLESMTITLTNRLDGDSFESLTADTSGTNITAAYDESTGEMLLSGSDTAANYQQVLSSIKYNNTDDSPTTTDRIITIKANDGEIDSALRTSTIAIVPVNDAPILDIEQSPGLTAISEDILSASNTGDSIASILTSSAISDPDGAAVSALAITGIDNSNGTWEYSINNGASWTAINSASESNSLLLDGTLTGNSTQKIRFMPNADFSGTSTITFRAWDMSGAEAAGSFVDTSGANSGGITPFSLSSDSAEITVTDVNDAPILDNSGLMSFSSITEDSIANEGNTISQILDVSSLGDAVTDVDTSAVEGIAITSVTDNNGTWQYKTAAGSWQSIAGMGVAANNALLLAPTDSIRFVPHPDFNDNIGTNVGSISFRAWDTTGSSLAGTLADTTTNGGITPFSTAEQTISAISITPENDAPDLAPTSPSLNSIDEDSFNNNGEMIGTIITDGSISEKLTASDEIAVEAMAITAVDEGNGTWEYSLNNGTTWSTIDDGALSDSHALLLDGTNINHRIRFVPKQDYNGPATFTYRAWDMSGPTSGQEGNYWDASTTGGNSQFSSATETASLEVLPVNDAPGIDITQPLPSLPIIQENDSNTPGAKVADIIGNSLTDIDINPAALEGIAITSVDNSIGIWQFSIDNGQSWNDINDGSLGEAHALLLAPSHDVRFEPFPGQNGNSSFTFRAWDQTGSSSGNAGSHFDINATGTGGTTPFSTSNQKASIKVNADPVAITDSVVTNQNRSIAFQVLTNDTDSSNDPLTVVGFSQASNGIVYENGSGSFTYTPNFTFNGADSFTYNIADGDGGSDTGTVNITILENYAPVANDDMVITNQNTPVIINVLDNDKDIEADPLKTSSFSLSAHGSITSHNNEYFLYTPNYTYFGEDQFTYSITDGEGGYSTATVKLTIKESIGSEASIPAMKDIKVPAPETVLGEGLAGLVNDSINDSGIESQIDEGMQNDTESSIDKLEKAIDGEFIGTSADASLEQFSHNFGNSAGQIIHQDAVLASQKIVQEAVKINENIDNLSNTADKLIDQPMLSLPQDSSLGQQPIFPEAPFDTLPDFTIPEDKQDAGPSGLNEQREEKDLVDAQTDIDAEQEIKEDLQIDEDKKESREDGQDEEKQEQAAPKPISEKPAKDTNKSINKQPDKEVKVSPGFAEQVQAEAQSFDAERLEVLKVMNEVFELMQCQ